jgi:hypothetical protein
MTCIVYGASGMLGKENGYQIQKILLFSAQCMAYPKISVN